MMGTDPEVDAVADAFFGNVRQSLAQTEIVAVMSDAEAGLAEPSGGVVTGSRVLEQYADSLYQRLAHLGIAPSQRNQPRSVQECQGRTGFARCLCSLDEVVYARRERSFRLSFSRERRQHAGQPLILS